MPSDPQIDPLIRELRAQAESLAAQVAGLQRRIAEMEAHLRDRPTPSEESEPVAAAAPEPAEARPPDSLQAWQSLHVKDVERERETISPPPPEPKAEAPKRAKTDDVGWELKLATVWMPRIGAVLLTVGAAIGASLDEVPPPLKVLLGYIAAAGVAGVGHFVRRHDLRLARIMIAAATALAYFVSFAGHYVPPMRVFPEPLAVALMVGWVGMVVFQAERWRSEAAATLAFALGVLASLVSADSSQAFALISLAVLAAGAGLVLVRHHWWRLTALAVAGTYLASVALWFIIPVGQTQGEVMAHLGALIAYHAIFTAAFWRWSRQFIAIEMAAEEAPEHDAAPRLDIGLLPYSTAFAIVNTVALVSLSLLLLWFTRVLWPHVEWLLFALAASEAARLASRRLRRGPLESFHLLTGFALATAAIVAAFSGLTESGVLAAQALALSIAASRTRMLRILRPLTAVCAAMAIAAYRVGPALPLADLPMHLVPALLLLASALPWEAMWVRHPRPFATGLLHAAELISGQWRGLVATVMAGMALWSCIADRVAFSFTLTLLGAALLAGVLLLRARAWMLGALVAALVGMISLSNVAEPMAGLALCGWLLLLGIVYLCQEVAARCRMEAEARSLVFVWFAVAIVGLNVALWSVGDLAPHRGLALAVGAAALAGLAHVQRRTPRIPALVPRPEADEPVRIVINRDPLIHWDQIQLGLIVAAPIALVALLVTIASDARTSLLSAAVIATALAGAWFQFTWRAKRRRWWELGAIGCALAVASLSVLHFAEMAPWSILAVLALGAVALVAGTLRLSIPAVNCGAAAVFAVPLVTLIADGRVVWAGRDTLMGLIIGVALVALTRLTRWCHRCMVARGVPPTDVSPFGQLIVWWLAGAGAFLLLVFLARGDLVAEQLVTVSWGAVGVGLLVAGFALRDSVLRHVSLVVFGVAVLRIFFHDLTGASVLTRAVAFLGVGLLMLAAGALYGFLRTRMSTDTGPPR